MHWSTRIWPRCSPLTRVGASVTLRRFKRRIYSDGWAHLIEQQHVRLSAEATVTPKVLERFTARERSICAAPPCDELKEASLGRCKERLFHLLMGGRNICHWQRADNRNNCGCLLIDDAAFCHLSCLYFVSEPSPMCLYIHWPLLRCLK